MHAGAIVHTGHGKAIARCGCPFLIPWMKDCRPAGPGAYGWPVLIFCFVIELQAQPLDYAVDPLSRRCEFDPVAPRERQLFPKIDIEQVGRRTAEADPG